MEELKIYRDARELTKRVFIIVKNFPREYKFTLGTRIQNTMLDCVDLIYRAARHKEKTKYIKPFSIYIRNCTKHRAKRATEKASINSYYGMFRHINCYNLRKSIAKRNNLTMYYYQKLI
jgi:hypothetical protein